MNEVWRVRTPMCAPKHKVCYLWRFGAQRDSMRLKKGEGPHMLLIETRVAEQPVEKGLRTPLLEALQGRGLVPLLRTARVSFFEQAAGDAAHARELERAVADWTDAEGIEPYVRGDVFCSDDFAHFLVFADESEGGGLRAGIVYDAETAEPARSPEECCRGVAESGEGAARGAGAEAAEDGGRRGGSADSHDGANTKRVEWGRRE